MNDMIADLENPEREKRLAALQSLAKTDAVMTVPFGQEVNNHVHTRYSFSPYSPSAVAYHARLAGLPVVGSVDHESIAAATEMKAAAEIVGMGATVGCEIRVSFDRPFAKRRLNNPDTIGNAYIVIHGIPAPAIETFTEWLAPLNRARELRNREQVERLNRLIRAKLGELGELDYDRDVRPLSWAADGGSVTERHILYALARRVLQTITPADRIAIVLRERLGIPVAPKVAAWIEDEQNPHREYDLLGAFKAELVPQFFIQPGTEECPPVEVVTALARQMGAIPAYSYLGDVAQSPTGDKKAQKFEDAYVDELFAALPALGFQAVTYMPPRNTALQLRKIQALAGEHNLMEISGVDINSSRQVFHCPEVLQPQFRHLIESTWALVGHEAATATDATAGIFGDDHGGTARLSSAELAERVARFAGLGQKSVRR